MSDSITLADLGELRVLDELVLPMARKFDATPTGDDCAFIETGGQLLAVSGDVGPRPAIQNLAAHREDWEAAGWLAVVATASDIATAGAKPLLLTNCIDAPAELPVTALSEFMGGYFSAMTEFGFSNGGGDLRHGPTLLARVFGVGVVEHRRRIGRGGASAGDHLVAIGPAGQFMANLLLAITLASETVVDHAVAPETLRFPRPQIAAMRLLAHENLIVAASDTSDGLLGAIDNIARQSQCGFHLKLDPCLLTPEVEMAARSYAVSAWNIFFAWGDWSVAALVPRAQLTRMADVCEANGIEWRNLGEVTATPGVTAELAGQDTVFDVNIVRNENFMPRGFNAGINGHLNFILRTPLMIPRDA